MIHVLTPSRSLAALGLLAALAGGFWKFQAAPNRTGLASGVITNAQAEVAAQGAFGTFKKLLAGETRSLRDLLTGVAVIEPGQEIHPPHQHAEEEFLYLAKGEGTWHLAGKEFAAHEGDLLYVEPWVMHGIKNTGKAPLTFFVVKWNGKQLALPEKPAAGH